MKYKIVPFTVPLLAQAYELFTHDYYQEQSANHFLPDISPHRRHWLQQQVAATLGRLAVAATHGDQVVAYMGVGAQFNYRGQKAVLIPEYGHASMSKDRDEIYQHLYAALAEELVSQGVHLHIIGHFSHNTELTDTLFQLGFGSIVAERLRDTVGIRTYARVTIHNELDWYVIAALEADHIRYYRQSPIFVQKDASPTAIAKSLEQHQQNGDRLFVYYQGQTPQAYFIVGKCLGVGEGRLLFRTNTAQIKGAYARPCTRGKGIGRALLQRTIEWARDTGYDHIFVEHETANLIGGSFWRQHFNPYLYFSMRYVDCTI